jgi:THUMP domain-containing protein
VDQLFDGRIQSALEELPRAVGREPDRLRAAEWLRARLGAELGREAALLRELRAHARGRFPGAERSYLTRKGLEQATRTEVAQLRAERIAGIAPSARVWDATCGVGGDAVALASRGLRVVASDADLRSVRCARENLQTLQVEPWAIQARAESAPVRADFAVLDPDRRARGARSLAPELWSPPLSAALEIGRRFRGACLKLPPAFAPEGLEAEASPGGRRWQWVSSAGELREVSLWTGELSHAAGELGGVDVREACALDAAGAHRFEAASSELVPPEEVGWLSPQAAAGAGFFAEPDAALIRSGLLGRFAREHGLIPLGPRLAYLASDGPARSPLLRSWRVVATSPLDPKLVRRMLGEHDVGAVTVMKRGHPDRGEVLERRFRGPGANRGLLAVARLERGHLALLLDPTP